MKSNNIKGGFMREVIWEVVSLCVGTVIGVILVVVAWHLLGKSIMDLLGVLL